VKLKKEVAKVAVGENVEQLTKLVKFLLQDMIDAENEADKLLDDLRY